MDKNLETLESLKQSVDGLQKTNEFVFTAVDELLVAAGRKGMVKSNRKDQLPPDCEGEDADSITVTIGRDVFLIARYYRRDECNCLRTHYLSFVVMNPEKSDSSHMSLPLQDIRTEGRLNIDLNDPAQDTFTNRAIITHIIAQKCSSFVVILAMLNIVFDYIKGKDASNEPNENVQAQRT
jgi:hypothetical protein